MKNLGLQTQKNFEYNLPPSQDLEAINLNLSYNDFKEDAIIFLLTIFGGIKKNLLSYIYVDI